MLIGSGLGVTFDLSQSPSIGGLFSQLMRWRTQVEWLAQSERCVGVDLLKEVGCVVVVGVW